LGGTEDMIILNENVYFIFPKKYSIYLYLAEIQFPLL